MSLYSNHIAPDTQPTDDDLAAFAAEWPLWCADVDAANARLMEEAAFEDAMIGWPTPDELDAEEQTAETVTEAA